MARPTSTFRCTECGWSTVKWVGRCGECQQWGTVVDVAETTGIVRAVQAVQLGAARTARPDHRGRDRPTPRIGPRGIGEFDRVLGGGIVAGRRHPALAASPGSASRPCCSRSPRGSRPPGGACSTSAPKSRRPRCGCAPGAPAHSHDELYLAAETDLATILGQIDAVAPDLLIVDSVQTVSSSLSPTALPGQPSQVREVASTLIRVAKERHLPVLLVGHVTKDGSIAGPRLLEHLVDVVCQFEGDRQTALRFVRALKNRFGPTDEVGCFEMTGDGIAEVPDPSGLFLSSGRTAGQRHVRHRRARGPPGARRSRCRRSSSRPRAPQPRRVVNGVDPSRVAMLLAVLERRAGLKRLGEHDVYVSTVGGVRLAEPGADLAIALAIASAVRDTRGAARARRVRRDQPRRRGAARDARPSSASPRRGASATRRSSTSRRARVRAAVSRAMLSAAEARGSARERELDARVLSRAGRYASSARSSSPGGACMGCGPAMSRNTVVIVDSWCFKKVRSHAGLCSPTSCGRLAGMFAASLKSSSATSPVFGSR